MPGMQRSATRTTAKEVRDGHENYRAHSRCGKAVQETAAEDAELDKKPAAENRPNQAKNDIRNAPIPSAPCDLTRKPASDQAYQNPADQATLPLNHKYPVLNKKQQSRRGHEAFSRTCASVELDRGIVTFSGRNPKTKEQGSLPNGRGTGGLKATSGVVSE